MPCSEYEITQSAGSEPTPPDGGEWRMVFTLRLSRRGRTLVIGYWARVFPKKVTVQPETPQTYEDTTGERWQLRYRTEGPTGEQARLINENTRRGRTVPIAELELMKVVNK